MTERSAFIVFASVTSILLNPIVIIVAGSVLAIGILVTALFLLRNSGKKKGTKAGASPAWQRQEQQAGAPGAWNQPGGGAPASPDWAQQQADAWGAQNPAQQQPGAWGAQNPAQQQQPGAWGAQTPLQQQPAAQSFSPQQPTESGTAPLSRNQARNLT